MKCVVLGFGFLAEYLMPCFERALGKCAQENFAAVKATERGMDRLRAKYFFSISAGNALNVLDRLRPDLVVISVKPHQVKALVHTTILPYLTKLREEGAPLPDFYSFASSPSIAYYTDAFGSDINIACMIPNMLHSIKGHNTAPIGVSFVAFDARHEWSADARRRALAFLEPTGTVLEIPPEVFPDYIALNCSCHILFEFAFIAQEQLQKSGRICTLPEIAQGYRAALHRFFEDPCTQFVPCGNSLRDLSEILYMFVQSWYQGLMKYCMDAHVPEYAAHRNICGSMETFLIEVQLESRAELEETTRMHATPGGYLEKVITQFNEIADRRCSEIWTDYLCGADLPDAPRQLADFAYRILQTTALHGRMLAE